MEAISVPKGFKVTPEQFEQLAHAEQTARMELTKDGELAELLEIAVSKKAMLEI